MRRGRCITLSAAAAALLWTASAAAAAPHTYTVVIDKMKFGPVPALLHKGDSIVWVNHDLFRHTATATDHSFDVDLQPNGKAKTVLNKAGTIAFVCRYHPGMRGTLHVQ